MSNQIHQKGIPSGIKLFGILLAVFGLLFTYMCYFNPDMAWPGANLSTPVLQFAFYSLACRSLAMVLALALAILSNRPKSMALVLIMRAVTELQDIGITIYLHGNIGFAAVVSIILILEVLCIIILFRIINKEENKLINKNN